MRTLLVVIATALLLAGCGTRAPSAQPALLETTEHTISVAGSERSYLLSVPERLPAEAPLVVMLHGGFGSALQARETYGWDELAASEGFVVAYPDGLGHAWNAGGGCCGKAGARDLDDTEFISAMVREIAATQSIDESRIFATGMSNGAMMSYRLACDTSIFAAIAPVAGTIVGTCDDPDPVSVLHVHGLADESVRMDGEPGSGTVEVDGLPVTEIIDDWRRVDACDPPTQEVAIPVARSAAECPHGRAVVLLTIDGAGHQWPGSDPVRAGADEPSDAVDATSVIWEFFAAHSRA